ncbi:MAG: C40 family peptidase [Oscillospiraceae bacterium]|nr:C40 family peptidase [Oscillospiraceae bacterium]
MEAPKLNAQITVGKPPVIETTGQKLVALAQDYMGVPYVWGGTTPKGFDCSGFTQYVFKQMGYTLKRTAAQQLTNGYSVTNLKVGDLVFFTNTYATSAAASHVGIYMGDNLFIHAAGGGVKITSLDHEYYAPRYIGARRIVE